MEMADKGLRGKTVKIGYNAKYKYTVYSLKHFKYSNKDV